MSWGSLKRRFTRSIVTMFGVILAIAFLTYMQVANNITQALIAADETVLNAALQNAGIEIFASQRTDRMMILLICLSLVTCLVGILNSMLMSVSERIKEIGTLKCLGALDSFIVKTYFIESSLQGIIGTLMGVAIGLLVAFGVSVCSFHSHVARHFPWGQAAGSVGISILIGSLLSIVASIAPAYIAARKQPVDAMRVEE